MSDFPVELKKKIAYLCLENRNDLEELDPDALESFASTLIKMILREKERFQSSHDLKVLEDNMKHLQDDSALLKNSEQGTDDYDFARNDCSSLMNSTRKWLRAEGLI